MYEYKAKILDVYDGDTFTFEVYVGFDVIVRSKMRLYGINTPEVRGVEKEYGKEVRDYVKSLIEDKEVTIKVYKKGKFGRYVAEVWFDKDGVGEDKNNLTEHLLETGKGKEFMKNESKATNEILK